MITELYIYKKKAELMTIDPIAEIRPKLLDRKSRFNYKYCSPAHTNEIMKWLDDKMILNPPKDFDVKLLCRTIEHMTHVFYYNNVISYEMDKNLNSVLVIHCLTNMSLFSLMTSDSYILYPVSLKMDGVEVPKQYKIGALEVAHFCVKYLYDKYKLRELNIMQYKILEAIEIIYES